MIYSQLGPDDKVIEINLSDIFAWYCGNRYSGLIFKGEIDFKDWSRRLTPKEDMLKTSPKFKGLLQRYNDGIPWRDTELFKVKYSEQVYLRHGNHCQVEMKKLDKKFETYDKLFQNINEKAVLKSLMQQRGVFRVYCIGER